MPLEHTRRLSALLTAHRLRRCTPSEVWEQAQTVADPPFAGLSPDVVDRVIELDGWQQDPADLSVMATLLAQVPATVTWPDPPAVLPPAPALVLTSEEQRATEEEDTHSAQLEALEANPDQFASWDEEDQVPLRTARRRVRRRVLVPDRLAFYRSFATTDEVQTARELFGAGSTSGIYLTTGGIERLAQEVFLPLGVSDQTALRCATVLLLGHEVGHLLVDLALAEADLARWSPDDRSVQTSLAEQHRAADRGFCREEEAFCEAYALRFLAEALEKDANGPALMQLGPEQTDEVLQAAQEHVADGLPGYRAGADITDVFAALVEVLRHAGAERPESGALLADLDRRTVTTADVRVRLIVSPGSAYGACGWFTPGDKGL